MRRALALAALLLALPALADLSREQWRVTRDVKTPALSRPGEVYLPLDGDALTAASLSEYRVVQAGKAETPYRMVLEAGATEQRPVPDKVAGWATTQDAAGQDVSAKILLDLGEDKPSVNLLVFDLLGEAYRCRVWIEESAAPAGPGKQLFSGELYRQGEGFSRTSATFPESRERYLRIALTRTQGKTFRVQHVSPFSVLNLPRRLDLVPASLARTEDAKHHRTVLDLDLGKFSRDLALLELTVAEPAFDRQAWLEMTVSDRPLRDNPPFEMADIVQLQRLKPTAPVALRFTLERARRLRLTVENGDDKPLTISKVTLWRVRRGLIFAADPKWEYQLWYGNPNALRPQYEIQRLPLTIAPAALPVATLGPAQITPPKPPPPPPWSESHPIIFWAALAVVVLLLALIIVKAMRSARGTEEGQ